MNNFFIVLQVKRTVNMKRAGRTPTIQALVMVGNRNGIAGWNGYNKICHLLHLFHRKYLFKFV